MKIERKLSNKKMMENRTKTVILVIAIALTTVMFTVLLTIFSSISDSQQKEEMRLSGSESFATIKYISDDDYELLKQAFGSRNVGYRVFISSQINNESLLGQSVEMSYMDNHYMATHFCIPSVGTVPVKVNEIICDSKTLDKLGINPEIGNTLSLEFIMRNQPYKIDFEIAGIIQSDAYSRQNIIVSEAFVDKYSAELEDTFLIDGEYSGIRMMDVKVDHKIYPSRYFINKLNENGYSLENQTGNFLEVSINPAFETQAAMDMSTVIGIIFIVFLIMFVGYLVIYNIFEISITQDIHFWALLRMIGTDKKAIIRIVRHQASVLMMLGIPTGVMIGGILGNILFPYIARTTTVGEEYSQYGIRLYAILFTVVFVAITVYYSAKKSARTAISISPVAALRCTDGEVTIHKKKRRVKKGSLRKLAAANVGRNKKRMMLVIISLSISLILFNCTFILANGIDREKYLQSKMKSDFVIGNRNYFNVNKHFRTNEDALDEAVINEIIRQEGFLQGGAMYAYTPMGESLFEYPDWKQHSETDKEGNQYIRISTGARYKSNYGMLSCQLYGADDYVLSNFEITEGTTDIEELLHKMGSGKYIIMSDEGSLEFAVGDTVTIVLDGQKYQYTLLAKMNQGRTEYCQFTTNGFCYYLSSSELKKISDATLMNYSFDVADIGHMENMIDSYCNNEWSGMSYVSAKTYYTSYENLKSEFWIVGTFMSAVIGGIGVINFINVILTSILSRRKEIAIMQSIGMQGKQLRKMLCTEGMIYSLLTLLGSFVLGAVLIPLVSNVFAGMVEYYAGYITIAPMIAFWILYLIISVIVPACGKHIISKDSVIARIRQE
ncbi:MAG: ABC transporter permease [Blautia sp.]|nr:ABC transporter permease [Lachnoclostridium sp.]MCM1210757.1 ABC transporter permease [Blautia sp.]